MTRSAAVDVLDAEGPGAPPRTNGELVFSAPWESRLFGITMALYESGAFEWNEFRALLIQEIGTWEAAGHPAEEWSYYERWAAAFEKLLAARGFCGPGELSERLHNLAARPHGHDH